jgi:hypothetical protein
LKGGRNIGGRKGDNNRGGRGGAKYRKWYSLGKGTSSVHISWKRASLGLFRRREYLDYLWANQDAKKGNIFYNIFSTLLCISFTESRKSFTAIHPPAVPTSTTVLSPQL